MSKKIASSHPRFPELVEEHFIQWMIKYQKDNDIKKQCGTNVQYLYDFMVGSNPRKSHYSSVKAAPVIAVYNDYEKNESHVWGGHVVLVTTHKNGSEERIDPSYEVVRRRPEYYNTINDYKLAGGIVNRDLITNFIDFTKIADNINNPDVYFVSERDFYNNQADYVEKELKKHFKVIHTY